MPRTITEYEWITREMEDLDLEDPYKDLSPWMHKLQSLNAALGAINASYQ